MHVAVGYAIAGLVVALIVWGFIGARHARFSDFVRPPVETLDAWAERVEGIDAGADDYLTKPFAWRSCSRACVPSCAVRPDGHPEQRDPHEPARGIVADMARRAHPNCV